MSAIRLSNIDNETIENIKKTIPLGVEIIEDVNDGDYLIGEFKYSIDKDECLELNTHVLMQHSVTPLMHDCRMALLKAGYDLYPKLYMFEIQDEIEA